MGLATTLSIDIQHNSFEFHYAECCYAECHDYLNVMLSVIMPNVIRLNVIMLNVVAPVNYHGNFNPAFSRVKILW